MTRRPRFPLALRLGWMERELTAAAKLLPLLIEDGRAIRGAADDRDDRVMILASLTVAALVLLGMDAQTLQAFVGTMSPEGDGDEAEDLGADLLEQVMTLLADADGEPN